MADGDGTAKRAWPGSPSDDLDAKRRRAGLTKEKQTRLGLTNDQVGRLALAINEVKELEEDGVQAWVEAVLREGRQKGSIEDKDSFIGKTVAVLAENGVTGAALVKLTADELMAAGIALGPATLLVSRLAPSPPLAAVAAPAEQLDLATENGRKQLVEVLRARLGLRTDRFGVPTRLTSDVFSFGVTQEREAAFVDLFATWTANCKADKTGREKLPLPAVPAAPGTGKTRFAWLAATRGRLPGSAAVDEEWRQAMDKLEAGDFKTGIQNAVGVAVTFNCDADPVEGEEHRYMIGVRMLYGHFCDVRVVTFARFLELLRYHGCHQIDTVRALQIIGRDIEVNHVLDGGVKRHVILVVDEPLRAMNADTPKERREQLGALTTSVGQLITHFPHVHVLMTSLSGKDLDEASKTASGRTVHFVSDFVLLSKVAVEALVAAEKDTVRRERLQTDRRFRAVLSECLGVPRLLEKVFEAASLAITDEAPCDTIRTVVAGLFKSHDKYKERQLRSNALLAALSGSWHPAGDARQHKTRAAEREGYLFDGRIPPLLLKWWWCMDEERHQGDEMHALLQAANGIYTLSDKVGGDEHGPRFERQLAHLWRILTITDAVSRREGDGTRKRTIHSMLGKGSDVARGAVFEKHLEDKEAAFNRTLTDRDVDVLQLPFKSLDDPAHGLEALMPGAVYLPTDDQNPGYDWTLSELQADPPFSVLVLVEAKFSGVDATTELSLEDIVEKFVLAVKKRPYVKTCLFESRLCYIIGGLRKVSARVMANREALIDAIVESLRGKDVAKHVSLKKFVGQSLLLLTRDHTDALLTSTLSSLPPFGEQW